MCGIIAYTGKSLAAELLISGLQKLEPRGYDSVGLATLEQSGILRVRTADKLAALSVAVAEKQLQGCVGIAHTRWATHGKPSVLNAHPHMDESGKIAIVHNGTIENHVELRAFLTQQGIAFQSETDTEVVAQLIGFFYQQTGDLLESVRGALREVSGAFGIVLMCEDTPGTLVVAKRGSPLVVGIGQDGYLVASDSSALVGVVDKVTHLADNEILCVSADGFRATTLDAVPIEKTIESIDAQLEQISLVGYEHHMLKEIHEQPMSLADVLRGRVDANHHDDVTLGGLAGFERTFARCRQAVLFGCGTSWHAGLIGEYLFEDLAGIPAVARYASELRYRNLIVEEGTIGIALSQSGETADTLAALEELKLRGADVFGVVNGVGSAIANKTDAGVYLHVGPEIGIASTKAFTAQVTVLTMLALFLGRRKRLATERRCQYVAELQDIPAKVAGLLEDTSIYREIAERLANCNNCLYLGRGVNFPVALEGALKLKEISYIHAEGLPAAEMKHGPLAMIDPNMPVIFIAPKDHTHERVLANIAEVRSRGGYVIAIATEGDKEIEAAADQVVHVPATLSLLSPLLTVVPLQLIAYYTAILRGYDVDRPRPAMAFQPQLSEF